MQSTKCVKAPDFDPNPQRRKNIPENSKTMSPFEITLLVNYRGVGLDLQHSLGYCFTATQPWDRLTPLWLQNKVEVAHTASRQRLPNLCFLWTKPVLNSGLHRWNILKLPLPSLHYGYSYTLLTGMRHKKTLSTVFHLLDNRLLPVRSTTLKYTYQTVTADLHPHLTLSNTWPSRLEQHEAQIRIAQSLELHKQSWQSLSTDGAMRSISHLC